MVRGGKSLEEVENHYMTSEVSYALSDGVHLAYRVAGKGPIDAMYVPMWFSNLDLIEGHPGIARGLRGLSSFTRIVLWDRRGSGLSDRLCGPATLEQGMDDVLAVLDAAGMERAALFGFNEAGTLCALMAATHPDRISALILYGSFATTTWHPDYPWGQKPEERAQQVELIPQMWGSKEIAQIMFQTDDDRLLEWGQRWQRNSMSPDAIPRFYDMLELTDVRHVLPTIRVPTLVLHRTEDASIPVENGRYIAKAIPGAKYVELPGTQHVPFLGDWDALQDEIEEFLIGERRSGASDRVLATILITDIVGSTKKAHELGDRHWRSLLDAHDAIARELLDRHQGRLVKNIGDGLLATFDGPARAIRCGTALRDELGAIDLDIRIGLHTGEVEVRGDDVSGIAVHIGARVAALAGTGELLVSEAVPPLVAGSGIEFEPRGSHELKGVQGEWRLFSVQSQAE